MRTVVAVLRGGPSSEYEVSLRSGATILEHLDREKYEPRDIFVTRKGEWHHSGIPMPPERALRGVDVAFNALHGEFGEGGGVQRLLRVLKVPSTGPDAVGAALAFNKKQTYDVVKKLGVKIPRGILISRADDLEKQALEIFRTFPQPAIVKPVIGGSSVGMTLVENFHTLLWGLEQAFKVAPKVIVEEFIKGREATVGVIEDFRNEKTYALLPIEIIPPASSPFFDYGAKYSGETIERSPGNFTESEKRSLMELAKKAHEGLGLAHYSRSDFIVSSRGIYFLEVNSAPAIGLTKESLFPKALEAVGSKLSEFFDHVISLTQKR